MSLINRLLDPFLQDTNLRILLAAHVSVSAFSANALVAGADVEIDELLMPIFLLAALEVLDEKEEAEGEDDDEEL